MRPDIYHGFSLNAPDLPNDVVKSNQIRNIFKVPNNVPDDETTERAMFWRNNGDIGMSSLTIWMHLLDVRHPESNLIYNKSAPSDFSDFKKCYLLLESVPEWKDKLDILINVSPIWKNLVKLWDDLTILYEEKNYSELTIKIKDCHNIG
tara:strand:- start:1030 stop:1476 length:447 start_codon:yes stop_codon:yes gene_type:complete